VSASVEGRFVVWGGCGQTNLLFGFLLSCRSTFIRAFKTVLFLNQFEL